MTVYFHMNLCSATSLLVQPGVSRHTYQSFGTQQAISINTPVFRYTLLLSNTPTAFSQKPLNIKWQWHV